MQCGLRTNIINGCHPYPVSDHIISMEVSASADGKHVGVLGNMRRAHLANMHRRVEAESQAACTKIASIQVCS